MSEYLDDPRMSQSKLKMLWNDPALFAEVYIHRTRPAPAPTPSMQFGTDCETYLFNGGFPDVREIPDNVLNGDGHRKGSAYKEWSAQWQDGTRLMKSHEYRAFIEPFEAIKKNVCECPKVQELVYGGRRKVVLYWTYLGVEMKSELDILHDHCIVDIKTTGEPSPEIFTGQIARLDMHVQAAAYQEAVEQNYGKRLPFVFVAIKNDPSYNVELITISEFYLQKGREKLGDMVQFYLDCQERNEWRSATWNRVIEVEPPRWMQYTEEYSV